jgi:hypothetical protein
MRAKPYRFIRVVRLRKHDGRVAIINPSSVAYIEPFVRRDQTRVCFGHSSLIVQGKRDDVAKKLFG